jgi:hypothetical protein
MSDIQITFSNNPKNARSESSLVIDPTNPLRMVAGSKKFTDPDKYEFTLATSWSDDGGQTWHPSQDLKIPGWDGISDPALAWDDQGNVFLVALPFKKPDTTIVGIAVYKSSDGGKTWSNPTTIHTSAGDDKQWACGDGSPLSPFKGRVYAAWDDGASLRFARTKDHGANWVGAGNGNTPAGTVLANDSFAPEINVAPNGHIYIAWIAGTTLKMLRSIDGGDTFTATTHAATGVTTLSQTLQKVDGWPVFPGGKFRVLTLPTACATSSGPNISDDTVAVAWADTRNGSSRIFFALSRDGGQTWDTGPSGQPLLSTPVSGNLHHFHPQMIAAPSGVIGCAYYEFGPKMVTPLIDTVVALSHDGGQTFSPGIVTDQPWDPSIDAPLSHGDPNVTFIGDYFGFDASNLGFYPCWTDTRTGIQELFTDRVLAIAKPAFDPNKWAIVAKILFGITNDGSGLQIVGGHVVPIGPWDPDGPIRDILFGLAAYKLVGGMGNGHESHAIQRAALTSVSRLVQAQLRELASPVEQANIGNGETRQQVTAPTARA